jgi:hypothetical protein
MAEPDFRAQVEQGRAALVERAVGLAADALADSVSTLRDLAMSAESESARIAAARALLQFIGHRRNDPVADAVRGATTIAPDEFAEVLRKVLDAALERLPDEEHQAFLDDLRGRIRPHR